MQLLSNGVARHSWDRFRRLCLQHFSCPFVSLRRLYSFCASFPCRLTPFGSATTTSTTSALKPITQIKTQRSNLANFRLSKDDATKGDQCKYSHVLPGQGKASNPHMSSQFGGGGWNNSYLKNYKKTGGE